VPAAAGDIVVRLLRKDPAERVARPGVFCNDVIVARLRADGTYDPAFEGGGKAAYEQVAGAGAGLRPRGRDRFEGAGRGVRGD
jgi:hypothetical protein